MEHHADVQVMLTLQLQSSWDWIPNHTLMPGTPNCILNIVVPLQVVTINTVLIDDDSIILIPGHQLQQQVLLCDLCCPVPSVSALQYHRTCTRLAVHRQMSL